MLLTGFPAGMLACNCYVLAPRAGGADAIVVDPGQRAFATLRRILDENRLTPPAAVLLTHGHIDHIWSAQKVGDTFGCPVYIHPPEDRFMLADPIRGFGPRLGQIALGALFREPKQVVELHRDGGDKIELGGITVTVDHTPGHTKGRWCSGWIAPEDGIRWRSPATRCSNNRSAVPICRAAAAATCWARSSKKLLVLDDDTLVLPGHGASTTIGLERRTNPFLEGLK